jgi:hypothetical protein
VLGFEQGFAPRMLLGFTMLLRLKPCRMCKPIACLSSVHFLTSVTTHLSHH